MTAAEFRPLFERVCDDYGLSNDAMMVAWYSCWLVANDGSSYLDGYAVRCYTMLDRTRGPWLPRSLDQPPVLGGAIVVFFRRAYHPA